MSEADADAFGSSDAAEPIDVVALDHLGQEAACEIVPSGVPRADEDACRTLGVEEPLHGFIEGSPTSPMTHIPEENG